MLEIQHGYHRDGKTKDRAAAFTRLSVFFVERNERFFGFSGSERERFVSQATVGFILGYYRYDSEKGLYCLLKFGKMRKNVS